jgi:hypothetical protein
MKAELEYNITLHKRFTSSTLLQTRFFIHKSEGDQSLNSGNKTSERYTREAIHRVLINTFSHSSSQPSGIEPGQMGLPENHKLSKAEY